MFCWLLYMHVGGYIDSKNLTWTILFSLLLLITIGIPSTTSLHTVYDYHYICTWYVFFLSRIVIFMASDNIKNFMYNNTTIIILCDTITFSAWHHSVNSLYFTQYNNCVPWYFRAINLNSTDQSTLKLDNLYGRQIHNASFSIVDWDSGD